MIHDPVADWRELSALYEQADLLTGSALREWLAALPANTQKLVPRLERMLAARTRAAAEQFLESMPLLRGAAPESSPLAWDVGRRVGPYRLVRHVGSGGMAEVWLADRDDGAFSRTVAIKLLHNHTTRAQRDTFVERFRRERDILASLDHPNIARLQDAGVTPDGQPWLALEYVEGENITTWCDRRRLTIEDRVRLFRQVLLAVEHAHARLVIHRDMKPSNVLVAQMGEVRLLDFGIAKLLEPGQDALVETELTGRGGRPLTLQYASPEQLIGSPLTTACDVYSLGVVLYELLVGELPYQLKGKSPAQIESAIVEVEPILPSRRDCSSNSLENRSIDVKGLRRTLRQDLDAILSRALEKSAARRYDSVSSMRLELERWLAHEPVQAVLPSVWYRVGKFGRRHRAGLSVAAFVLCALAVAGESTLLQSVRAQREATRAVASKNFLLETFRLSSPNQTRAGDVSAEAFLDVSMERAHRLLGSQPELLAEVLSNIAAINQDLNRYERAETALGEVSEIYEKLGRHKEWLSAKVELADNAWRMGDVKRADLLMSQLLPELEALSSDRGLQARQHEVRGWLARENGDLSTAKAHMLTSYEDANAAYGKNDNRTANALQGLAGVEAAQGDYSHAREDIARAHLAASAAPNSTPIDLLGIDLDRARIEFAAGEYAIAMPLTEATVASCDKTVGSQVEDCFLMREQEALLLMKMGEAAESLQALPVFREEATNNLSPRRQMEAKIMSLRILSSNAKWPEARTASDELRQFLDGEPASRLPQGDRVSAYQAIAEFEIRAGDGPAAESTLNSLDARADVSGAGPAYHARTLMLRGLAMRQNGEHQNAIRWLQAAEIAYSDSFGPVNPQTLLCRLNQIPSLLAMGNRTQAVALVDEARATLQKHLPANAAVMRQISKMSSDLSDVDYEEAKSKAFNALFFN